MRIFYKHINFSDYDGTKLDTAVDYADINELAEDSEVDNPSQNDYDKVDTTDYDADDDDEPGRQISYFII